jgi:formylglycine-generating enzyme required for sulfatase activity
VSGGLFFFGETTGPTAALGSHVQLTRVSSFLMDEDEFTVGRLRALLATGVSLPLPVKSLPGQSRTAECTWLGPNDATNDALPLNCVSRNAASRYCAAEGSRLPTEAEYAFVAANGALATRFPWGNGADICGHAIVARAPFPFEASPSTLDATDCRSPDVTFGPAVGTTSSDVTIAFGGIRNLGGNLEEWAQDNFVELSDPCWTAHPFLSDPRCNAASGEASIHGGSWSFPAWTAASEFRDGVKGGGAGADLGFRCVLPL